MAEGHHEKSLIEKIADKVHGHGSSSSSDSDADRSKPSIKSKIYRLFGREQPVHKVLGGGTLADVFLWRDKKVSATVLGTATAMWVWFELLECHLLTLVCHSLILALATLFIWSSATICLNNPPPPPHIPDVSIPENLTKNIALSLSYEINRGFAVLKEIASGREMKKFLLVNAGLLVLSILGSCCNFLTVFYIVLVALFTVPVLYEKYEDKVDPFVEKAMAEIRKQYAVFDAKVLSKIPRGTLRNKQL